MKNTKVLVDLNSIPDGWDIETWLMYVEKHKIVFYDSHRGKTPIIIDEDLKTKDINLNE